MAGTENDTTGMFRCDCCGGPAPAAVDEHGLTYCDTCAAELRGAEQAEREFVAREFRRWALRAASYLSIDETTDAFAAAMARARQLADHAASIGQPYPRDMDELDLRRS